MNYTSELKKFVSSQYIYSGVRIALAIVIPSIILAHFGILKDFFLFPLGTSFVGLTDQPGPFIRRRNSLILSVISFFLVAIIASFVKNFQFLVFSEILFFGIFFSMIGVYGQRLASIGSLSLVVLAIFIDGHMTGTNLVKSMLIFLAGCSWFVIIFLVVSKIQPYKLAEQMIGENYLELSEYLKIKAKFYLKYPNYDNLFTQVIAKQIKIKNLQEDTRETLFRTRTIVNESTTTSRLLILMFLNSVDLHEKLITSENDYRKIQENFGDTEVLQHIHDYLIILSDEIVNIGIALQSGTKIKTFANLTEELHLLYDKFFNLRNMLLTSENLENFMILRQILMRITEITDEVKSILIIDAQDPKIAKSLSTGLDYRKFLSKEERLSLKVLKNNISLKSSHFRHALRITSALLLGYTFSKFSFLGIGHSYWILITIIAILKPAYSITKSRNMLRLYGTIIGAIIAYILLMFISSNTILLIILLTSMILCFSFLRGKYFWAVLFMTIYIFLSFNFLNPGHVNIIFKDRILDTIIGGLVSFAVAYFVFPVWEHTQNVDLMKKTAKSSMEYFETVMNQLCYRTKNIQKYKLKRKEAIIDLANLSDNFQRMISDPKNQRKKQEVVHQFVTTSHLLIAYTASLSQYSKTLVSYPEIDFESWKQKITDEISRTKYILDQQNYNDQIKPLNKIIPEDHIEDLLTKRKSEIDDNLFYDRRDPRNITRLTELKNIREILELIHDVAKEQRKIIENYYKTNPQ